MAAFKLSIIMKYLSGDVTGLSENRSGGFSESVYWSTFDNDVRTAFLRLAQRRAALLPKFSAVTGYRVQQVDPTGPASSGRVFYPGPTLSGWESDIPQMGILISLPGSGVTNVKRHRMAAIPDKQVKFGEWAPESAYVDTFSRYLAELRGWKFRGADLTKTFKLIKDVDALGNVTLTEDLLILPTAYVTLRKVVLADGRTVSKTFKVDTVTDTKHFKLQRWTYGAATLGRVREFVPIYPAIVIPSPAQPTMIVRKIGRPSKPYVGHQSKKRG